MTQTLRILYANIKHAFYQPCNGTCNTQVMLHFSLKHPITVGNKAHKEIQVRRVCPSWSMIEVRDCKRRVGRRKSPF